MSQEENIRKSLAILVGILLFLIAVLLFPWVFGRYLAIGSLLPQESANLNWASGTFFLVGILLILFRKWVNTKLTMVILGICFIVFAELGFRLVAHYTFDANYRWQLEMDQLRTYPDYSGYSGHPFTHFTRHPKHAPDDVRPNIYEYNSLGFNDIEHTYEKPDSVFRVACLGASTTARGYPRFLEKALVEKWQLPTQPVALNFGISSWTSAHSMVNFLLNVVEFDPDVIVIHHGWNESEIRNTPKELFRPDYSHAYKHFHEPVIKNKLLIQTSLIFRVIRKKLNRMEDWMFLDRSTMKRKRPIENKRFNDTTELRPYKRNLSVIIDQALKRNIEVVLLTMPINTDLSVSLSYQGKHIHQCNRIAQELKREYEDQLTLVDLDSLMTGKNELYIDLAHVTDEGKAVKAEHISDAIIDRLNSNRNTSN